MAIVVEVTSSKTGQSWRFSQNEFARWKRDMGGKAAFLWESGEGGDEVILIDTQRLLKRTLSHGDHRGSLVVRTKVPAEYASGGVEAWQLA